MIGALLAILMFFVLVALVRATSVTGRDEKLMRLMIAGYLARLIVQAFSRDLSLFSHGGGGDYMVYELWALEINRFWGFAGVQYVTADDIPLIGPTSLPPNLFALVIALNGGEPTPLGCTAIVAVMGCLTCLNLYRLAVDLGADPRRALTLAGVLLFSPAFLLYTSDMYKDGLVLFVTTGAVSSSIRLARRFSVGELISGALFLLALWHIRFYLVFVAAAPLVVGLTGVKSRSVVRPLFAMLLLGAAFATTLAATDVVDTVSQRADAAFEKGTNKATREINASGGSGVSFDDGGNAWGAMGPKLAYTILSPFPWAGGSVGFHIGKIDTLLWYFILWRSWIAAKRLWREDRATLLMFLAFIIPILIMYATSFSNVGLMLRQRLSVVMVAAVLAMQSWPKRATAPAGERRLTLDRSVPRRPPGLVPASAVRVGPR